MPALPGDGATLVFPAYERALDQPTMVAIRDSSSSTVRLSVGVERPRGIGSFKALRLPCLEASYPSTHPIRSNSQCRRRSADGVAPAAAACAPAAGVHLSRPTP